MGQGFARCRAAFGWGYGIQLVAPTPHKTQLVQRAVDPRQGFVTLLSARYAQVQGIGFYSQLLRPCLQGWQMGAEHRARYLPVHHPGYTQGWVVPARRSHGGPVQRAVGQAAVRRREAQTVSAGKPTNHKAHTPGSGTGLRFTK